MKADNDLEFKSRNIAIPSMVQDNKVTLLLR